MDVTLLPRITCENVQLWAKNEAESSGTDHSSNGVSLGRSRLLLRIIQHKVQEQIITTQCSADFATALQVHEQPFVHELSLR